MAPVAGTSRAARLSSTRGWSAWVTERATRLRHDPGFRRFWAASTISGFGTYISSVAFGVLVVADLGGTATDVGLVQAAGVAPYLAVGLFAGVLADRVRRKPLLVGTELGRAVVLAGVPLLAVTGALTVPVLAALMVVFGLLSALNAAAHQSFLPRLVPRELLPRANARLEQSAAVAQTTGPLLGGGLIAAIGAPLTVLVDAVSYALSGLILAAPPSPTPRRGLRPGRSWPTCAKAPDGSTGTPHCDHSHSPHTAGSCSTPYSSPPTCRTRSSS